MIIPNYIAVPKGLDVPIRNLQEYINDNFSLIDTCFGRAYKNQNREGQYIPEVYYANNEYKEVYALDYSKGFAFFDVDETTNILNNNSNTYKKENTVRIIFFTNLDKSINLSHRGDEDFIASFETIFNSYSNVKGKFILNRILKGVSNVFTNYNYEISSKLVDMQPLFICSFEFTLTYTNNSKC